MAKNGAKLSGLKKGDGQLTGPAGSFSIYNEGQTSCSIACPAGVDIKAYVNLIADRKYEDAVHVIRRNNPFPGICGRVCTHPCEFQCGRKDIDEAVSIRSLKRFATDYELSRKKPGLAAKITHSEKVAVVGSGPAGLTAASDLALAGFHVTVFDESKVPGGLLSWGIPDFRLPKNIVRSEIRDIQNLGVSIVAGNRVDMPAELLKKGYSAVVLAMGCQKPMPAGIPGEGSAMDCLDFLKKVSEGTAIALGRKVIVIGGGNAALDSARTALRLGAAVTVAYRRTEEQMPADAEEIAHAKEEGVKFELLAIPAEILQGKMKFQRARLGEPDASGRRSPVPVPNDFFELDADTVIMAIGSKADASGLPKAIALSKSGTPLVDGNGMTTAQGIFAAGDLATGPSTIVDAIGSGHDAAAGVMSYLGAEPSDRAGPAEMLVVEAPPSGDENRCAACFIPLEKRRSTFEEAEMGMDERQAITEAQRCQRCGSCTVCDVCLAVCDYRNAVISVDKNGESAFAKVPFQVASKAMDQREGWKVENGRKSTAVRIEPLLARVDETLCIACERCEEACPYKAIRTVFDTSGNAVARVEESACRGCGACVAACPAGAMTMGYLDDSKFLARMGEAVKRSADNNGIVRLSCLWNRSNSSAGEKPWEVRVQCTRRLSPSFLVETLAMGARAIAVVGCGEDDCHYLPGPWMGQDVVDSTREILAAAGINPARVAYIDESDSATDFIYGIKGLVGFKPLPKPLPPTKAGLGRCLDALQVLMAQPDMVRNDAGKTVMGLGCLGISEPAFAAYGVGNNDILKSIFVLLKNTNANIKIAWHIHNSGNRLREMGFDALHNAYMESIKNTVCSNNIEKLVIPTPKSYGEFVKMDLGCKVESLPSVLLREFKGRFVETSMTVAYHPACSGGGDYDSDCLKLLGKVPGLKVVDADGSCGDSGWRDMSSESGKRARALLKRADESGAALLVAGSARCAAHLRAATAGWTTSPVKVMDVYTFLASRLGGE